MAKNSLEKLREQSQRGLMQDPAASDSALRVLIAIGWHMNRKHEGLAWPSIATLAKITRLHPRTVIRAEQWLEASGYLEVKRSPRGSRQANRYRLLPPTSDKATTY
jgi:hypothetical protein